MEQGTNDVTADLTARLRRIEGQARGVQRMIEEGRDCQDILQQMAAIRSAVQQASLVLARSYMASCLRAPDASENEAKLDRLISTLAKLD